MREDEVVREDAKDEDFDQFLLIGGKPHTDPPLLLFDSTSANNLTSHSKTHKQRFQQELFPL